MDTPIRNPLLEEQIRAAERLRHELAQGDGSHEHPYFRALRRQLARYRRTLAIEELEQRCFSADVVYVADYHAVPRCQHFAADMLSRFHRARGDVSLGIEFVFARQQPILDRRQAGELTDPEFLRRIHYREEWGYPWDGFRHLLDAARELNIAVHALDSPPRGGFSGLRRRDDHAARRIVSILQHSSSALLVLFGETHLTRGHLPAHVRRRLRRQGRDVIQRVVFQNPDLLYWQRVRSGDPLDRPVEIDEDTFAVFHTSPLEKYEAYRQVLERWRGDVPDDEAVDLTPAVHHVITVLLRWLRIDPLRYRLRHRAGWVEGLADAFPEVYGGGEAVELLTPILEEYQRSPEEIDEARHRLARDGALYEPRSNTLFMLRYLPGRAAGEGARFLRAALTGRLFIRPADFDADPADRAYGAAYTEALAYLGSRLVDPTAALTGPGTGARGGPLSAVTPDEERWLQEHRRFEGTRRPAPPPELLVDLRASRRLRRLLAFELGHRLGRVLFERVRDGRLDRMGLRRLFVRPLRPQKARRFVLRLLRRGA